MKTDFLKSENKSTYILLACKYLTSPCHIYELAHGKGAKRRKDQRILKELEKRGIISGIKVL